MRTLIFILGIISSFQIKQKKPINPDVSLKLHFIKTGSSDSILIEANGQYGLVDSGNPYLGEIDEVEKVVIDPSKGEENQGTTDPNQSVKAVINYLDYLGVQKLSFIVSTHAHSDHLGGIPAIAFKYVDENTIYYFRSYRKTLEDTTQVNWANHAYYEAAFKSMALKKAQMVDVTDRLETFDFGGAYIELLNTDIDPDELNLGENQNSIVTSITYKDKKIVLAADMIAKDDKILKDQLGKIDVLKLAHHGYSESSYEFISTCSPSYVVVLNNGIPDYGRVVVAYLQNILGSEVYITGNIADSTDSVEESAIRLYVYDNDPSSAGFYFENEGEQVDISGVTGWLSWNEYWVYVEGGIMVTEWQELDWKGGHDWFYFNEEGIMLTGWQELEYEGEIFWYYFDLKDGFMVKGWKDLDWDGGHDWFYFDDSGHMLTGWHDLDWSQGHDWFYFDDSDGYMYTGWHDLDWSGGYNTFYFLENGVMVANQCIEIDGETYCFDENGCLIEE